MTSAPNDLINRSESCDATWPIRRDNMDSSQDRPQARSQPLVECKVFLANKRQCTSVTPDLHRGNTSSSDLNSSGEDLNNNNSGATKRLEITLSEELRYDANEDYKMDSNPRGICLIVNNVTFETSSLPERKGSDKDAMRFRVIFKECGFHVESKRNLDAEKMKILFTQIAAQTKRNHDALVVIVLSHGNETSVYGTDGIEVDLNEMLTHFDNINCKQLMGKPKFFAIQACRGRLVDYGIRDRQTFLSQVDTQDNNQFSQQSLMNSLVNERTTSTRWSELDREYNPTRTDMLLCFSCLPGYGSIRNEDSGSWFAELFATHFSKHAHKRHLIEILNMVSRDIRLRRSDAGHKQVLEVTTIGFDRNLYFNPGQYRKK